MIFSEILENDGKSEMGLSILSPFLSRGFISANFNLVGNVPEDNIRLQMGAKDEDIYMKCSVLLLLLEVHHIHENL